MTSGLFLELYKVCALAVLDGGPCVRGDEIYVGIFVFGRGASVEYRQNMTSGFFLELYKGKCLLLCWVGVHLWLCDSKLV
jgi:hypothetical protein